MNRRLAPLTNCNRLIYRTTRYVCVGCWFCARGRVSYRGSPSPVYRERRVSRWKGRTIALASRSRKSSYSLFRVKGPAHLRLMTNIFRTANVLGRETTVVNFIVYCRLLSTRVISLERGKFAEREIRKAYLRFLGDVCSFAPTRNNNLCIISYNSSYSNIEFGIKIHIRRKLYISKESWFFSHKQEIPPLMIFFPRSIHAIEPNKFTIRYLTN